jgi:outer membrane protein TolC
MRMRLSKRPQTSAFAPISSTHQEDPLLSELQENSACGTPQSSAPGSSPEIKLRALICSRVVFSAPAEKMVCSEPADQLGCPILRTAPFRTKGGKPQKLVAILCAAQVLFPPGVVAQSGAQPAAQASTGISQVTPFEVHMPKSLSPFAPYTASSVPELNLSNSPRLDQLIRDGKLYLSLRDAIALALENNLDLAIARYNLPIADTDVLRTRAGGFFRGVNAGVVQNTQGGTSAGGAGSGAGGTSSGAGGAGAGAGGLVQSTLGVGPPVSSYDPQIQSTMYLQHATQPEVNLINYGVPYLKFNSATVNGSFLEALPTGTSFEFDFDNQRQTINSPYQNLSPALTSYWQFTLRQQLLSGFGVGPNLRYLLIAKNNKNITDLAFKHQVIVTVTQIEEIYWDLVNAFQDDQVKTAARDFAQKTLDDTRKQFDLQAVPAMDVMRAEAEVASRDQDLTVARTTLQLQESLIKNAVTKSLEDPILEEMPVVPTDTAQTTATQTFPPVEDLINQALKNSPTLAESNLNLENEVISRKSARNNLLPALTLQAYYAGQGLAGEPNPTYNRGPNTVSVPSDWPGAANNAFNNSSPNYYVGLNLTLPLRNRVAKADQFRSELEYRQNELYAQQLKKQIRINVRNAEYTLEQSSARVAAAAKARDLAQRTFDITKQEQQLGAGSIYQTLTAQRDLSIAESALVAAETTYEKAKVELDQVTGTTLDRLGISIAEAKTGVVAQSKL